MLDRAEEAEKSVNEQHALANLHPERLGTLGKQDSSNAASAPSSPRLTQDDNWQQPATCDGIFKSHGINTRDGKRGYIFIVKYKIALYV